MRILIVLTNVCISITMFWIFGSASWCPIVKIIRIKCYLTPTNGILSSNTWETDSSTHASSLISSHRFTIRSQLESSGLALGYRGCFDLAQTRIKSSSPMISEYGNSRRASLLISSHEPNILIISKSKSIIAHKLTVGRSTDEYSNFSSPSDADRSFNSPASNIRAITGRIWISALLIQEIWASDRLSNVRISSEVICSASTLRTRAGGRKFKSSFKPTLMLLVINKTYLHAVTKGEAQPRIVLCSDFIDDFPEALIS